MVTFLLYWNPYFSSCKMDDFLKCFYFPEGKDVLTEEDDRDCFPESFNWSVVEHEKARCGDRFVFVKVGYGKPTGVVGVGHFVSEPYEAEDWSGQGRRVFYMDMEWESVVRPDSDKVLKTEVLAEAVPEVLWTKGKAGVMVASEVADRIEALWQKHLEEIK
ncbi:MAG: hypothetical protein IKX60_04290 [Bacteroidales bacterium]|nr:hypothetical protein [Bacteroidales bacterium]